MSDDLARAALWRSYNKTLSAEERLNEVRRLEDWSVGNKMDAITDVARAAIALLRKFDLARHEIRTSTTDWKKWDEKRLKFLDGGDS